VRGGEKSKTGVRGCVWLCFFLKRREGRLPGSTKSKPPGGIPGFDLLPLKIKVAALVLAEKPEEREGGGAPLKKMGLGLGFFCIFSDVVKIAPPLKIQYSMVFIGRVLLGFQISPSTFPFLLFSSFFFL
jgi:hypothetical protein